MDLKVNMQLIKVNRQLMMNEPRWYCGTRIRTGAIAAAIIGAICNAIMVAGFLIIGFTNTNIPNFKEVRNIALTGSSLNVISLPLYIAVIYAAKKDKAWAYLPYLILQGIILVLCVILTVLTDCLYIILCILDAKEVATIDIGHPYDGTDKLVITINLTFIMMAFLLITFLLEAYLYYVIWRAYMFTKEFYRKISFKGLGLNLGFSQA